MNRLKEVRIATGKKQYEVAEDLGTSQQVLSRYERGETEPDYKTLCRLFPSRQRELNKKLDELFD